MSGKKTQEETKPTLQQAATGMGLMPLTTATTIATQAERQDTNPQQNRPVLDEIDLLLAEMEELRLRRNRTPQTQSNNGNGF